jgi:hypothetical protein
MKSLLIGSTQPRDARGRFARKSAVGNADKSKIRDGAFWHVKDSVVTGLILLWTVLCLLLVVSFEVVREVLHYFHIAARISEVSEASPGLSRVVLYSIPALVAALFIWLWWHLEVLDH